MIHNQYNYESPWCFPVEFQEKSQIQEQWDEKINKLNEDGERGTSWREDDNYEKLQKSTSNYFIWRAYGSKSDVPKFKDEFIQSIYGKGLS